MVYGPYIGQNWCEKQGNARYFLIWKAKDESNYTAHEDLPQVLKCTTYWIQLLLISTSGWVDWFLLCSLSLMQMEIPHLHVIHLMGLALWLWHYVSFYCELRVCESHKHVHWVLAAETKNVRWDVICCNQRWWPNSWTTKLHVNIGWRFWPGLQ